MSTEQKRPEKIAIFREAEELLKGKEFAFLVDFGGLSVTQISEVRGALAAKEARFVVIKNSILGKVAAENGWEDISGLLTGPTAVVVGGADVADVAKTVVDFVKKSDKAAVKGGQMNNKLLSKEEVDKLSGLISLAAQQARLLGTLQAPASKMARVLQAKVDKENEGSDAAPAEVASAE